MNILLDENIPSKLKLDFGNNHTVSTVRERKFTGKSNGELLSAAVSSGFDVFITMDKNLQYQQNLSKYPITIILLKAINNKHQTLQMLVPKITGILRDKQNFGVIVVE